VEIEVWEAGTGFVWWGFMTQAELNRAWLGNWLFLPAVLRTE
jgi:hypothetical protein